ncbi:type II secretion system F family protein [Paenibacillus sp. J5C_2022]|uniref:type II secretion system F family protein n=1 Tax=Paenibacillus sp. J5C2022 TaxID=2977129 RepID=UPI0021D376D5|nr:type II secretion system F family protein [Paenibacillus sp. J5C2022]MCU6710912.1 type II secretion system F family protein [Paenibacillus sp. J5C2022]
MAAAVAAVLLTACWLYGMGGKALRRIGKGLFTGRGGMRSKAHAKEMLLEAPFLKLLEHLRLYDKLALQFNAFHMKLAVLKGQSWTIERSKREAAATVGGGYAALTGGSWLAWIGEESLLLLVGLLLGIVLLCRPYVEAGRELERRKRKMVAALPGAMSRLMLLVGAGDTVANAFQRCLEGREGSDHPLYKEWEAAAEALRNGQSFSSVMERFNRSCAIQEIAVFTTALLLNYRRGGDQFVLALRELSYSLWDKRKEIARTGGEEASSKLVFPLVAILLVMMVLVAAPAVMVL